MIRKRLSSKRLNSKRLKSREELLRRGERSSKDSHLILNTPNDSKRRSKLVRRRATTMMMISFSSIEKERVVLAIVNSSTQKERHRVIQQRKSRRRRRISQTLSSHKRGKIRSQRHQRMKILNSNTLGSNVASLRIKIPSSSIQSSNVTKSSVSHRLNHRIRLLIRKVLRNAKFRPRLSDAWLPRSTLSVTESHLLDIIFMINRRGSPSTNISKNTTCTIFSTLTIR